jgi:hypothetical protein
LNKIIIINFYFFFFNNITTSYRVFFFNWLNNIHILNIFIRIFFLLSFEKRFLKKNNYIYDLEGGGNKHLVFFFLKGILIKIEYLFISIIFYFSMITLNKRYIYTGWIFPYSFLNIIKVFFSFKFKLKIWNLRFLYYFLMNYSCLWSNHNRFSEIIFIIINLCIWIIKSIKPSILINWLRNIISASTASFFPRTWTISRSPSIVSTSFNHLLILF